MEKERQTNFELLRVLLMIAIPLYHFMVYLGVVYLPQNKFTIPGLIICSGSAIVADYAFMALSAYFMLKKNKQSVFKRFLKLLVQVLLIYLVKKTILCDIYGYSKDVTFYNDFFVKGSWWFIYVYFIILLIYPIFNCIIFKVKLSILRLMCIVLGICFFINGCTNNVNIINDILCFVFAYFIMGYFKRIDYKYAFGMKVRKRNLVVLILVGYIITLGIGVYIKVFSNASIETANYIIQCLIGKYSFIQFFMGISIFLFFKILHIPLNKSINNIAKSVFYVFLLHETVLAVFWYYGKLRTVDNQLPFSNALEFIGCCSIYLIVSFLFAFVIRLIYGGLFRKYIDFYIEKLCDMEFIRKIENKYLEVTAWKE